ncbi:hypothetical protein D3C80_2147950 [compost metagenome]
MSDLLRDNNHDQNHEQLRSDYVSVYNLFMNTNVKEVKVEKEHFLEEKGHSNDRI